MEERLKPPARKVCPKRLEPWTELAATHEDIYHSVCEFLAPSEDADMRVFRSVDNIQFDAHLMNKRLICSEDYLRSFMKQTVESYVRDIIAQLYRIPAARERFRLDSSIIEFANHFNFLDRKPFSWNKEADRRATFCVHALDEECRVLTTGEYKTSHKLALDVLRLGLRPLDFQAEIIDSPATFIAESDRQRARAARLTGSALVQTYQTMMELGLEYGYITTGLGLVLLRIPHDDPATLNYHLCQPVADIDLKNPTWFQQPVTAIARVLCLCLMSHGSQARNQDWRVETIKTLPIWRTSFDHEYAIQAGRPATLEDSCDHDPIQSPSAGLIKRRKTKSHRRTPPRTRWQTKRLNTSREDPDPGSSTRQKRRRSQEEPPGGQRKRDAQYCTQKCLLGLKKRRRLDESCPNVDSHRVNKNSKFHSTTSNGLVQLLKNQLDHCIDHAVRIGGCGSSGVPFKLTCERFGYTIVGKGTTCSSWPQVSREADVYRVLSPVQGSAVPVFIGKVDLDKWYFLHEAGRIQHMILMAWGGEIIETTDINPIIRMESIGRAQEDIASLGVKHQDLHGANILWNRELGRAMIIDFNHCEVKFKGAANNDEPEKTPGYNYSWCPYHGEMD